MHDEEFLRQIKAIVYTHIKAHMAREDVRERFTAKIDEKLNANLQKGLPGFAFQVYKRTNRSEYEALLGKILDRVPGSVVEIIEQIEDEAGNISQALRGREDELESFFSRMVMDVLERIDIRTLLSRQMAHFDEAKLEEMIWSATNEQLLYIQYLGTLLGILGGFLIWQPLFMGGVYLSIFGILFVADQILDRIKKKKT